MSSASKNISTSALKQNQCQHRSPIDVRNGATWRSRTVSIVRKCRCRAFKFHFVNLAVGLSNEVCGLATRALREEIRKASEFSRADMFFVFNGRAGDRARFWGINGSFFGLFHRRKSSNWCQSWPARILPKISATQRRNGAKLPSRATKRRREKCQLGETVPLIRLPDGNGFTHRLWH